ncbi:MAG: S8 family serine peptidase [candidate division Zixibacteria bacterium]|nr:S8 family serine peptidase [candidate division Zixibacteria bacterium]
MAVAAILAVARIGEAKTAPSYVLHLAGGDFVPQPGTAATVAAAPATGSSGARCGIIQFTDIPTAAARASLASRGINLYGYLPDMAFLAAIPPGGTAADLAGLGVRWIGSLRTDDKLSEILARSTGSPNWCRDSAGVARFTVKVYPNVSLAEASLALSGEYGAVVIDTAHLAHAVAVGLPADNWLQLAADPRVVWIEPFWPRVEHNNSNRANVAAEQAQAPPYSLTGSGINVGEWDGGRADPSHPDFGGRVVSADASAISTHSTHVAGTVMGSGLNSGGTYRGMAPGAVLMTRQWWLDAATLESSYNDAIQNFDIDISTNSWGLGLGDTPTVPACESFLGNYFLESGTLDDIIRGSLLKPVTVSWSAGNERITSSPYCGSVGFTYGTVTPYGTTKNVITVGAINSDNSTMTYFSSWGPTDDGRLKPELVAPGCQTNSDHGVTSTKPGGGYATLCGTSMAAPTVTGCVALWMERYKATHAGAPLASTVKAVFVESADDLGAAGPSYDFGYGRIDVTKAVDLLDAGRFLEDSITHGQNLSWSFVNDGSLSPISFTLVWDDPGAAENASVTLINDLDLKLTPPSGSTTYHPWILDPANPAAPPTTGVDNRNNLEQVRRTSGLETGTWIVEIDGTNIPQGPQRFSLAYSAGITLTSLNQAYAVNLTAGADESSLAQDVAVSFTLTNFGLQNDTYNVSLLSARGWTITPNPEAVALNAQTDSNLTFTLSIPAATPFGNIDTVIAVAVSQADGSVTDRDTIRVTVISGRAVTADAGRDTVGVPGRTILLNSKVVNAGLYEDTIDWTSSDELGWSVLPAGGTAILPVGQSADLGLSATVAGGATVGSIDRVFVSGLSRVDPSAQDVDTARVTVINLPPVPLPVSLIGGNATNDVTPLLVWSHVASPAPPPGFNVYSHILEIGGDTLLTVGPVRYGPINDTSFAVPDVLADGAHFWRVMSRNAIGDSSAFSPSAHLEIDTQAPQVPALLSPSDGTADADTTPVFTWTAVPGLAVHAEGGQQTTATDSVMYRWEASTDPQFLVNADSAWTSSTSHQVADNEAFSNCNTHVYWRVAAMDAAGNVSASSGPFQYFIYQPGDINADCVLDVVDVVGLIEYAFRGGPPPNPPGRAEINCTAPTNITDVVTLIGHVFRGGPPPCSPP